MKRKITIIALVAFILGAVNETNAQFSFGLRAGMNFSAQSENGNLYDGQNYNLGKTIGPTIEYNISELVSLHSEALYQTKGGQSLNIPEQSLFDVTHTFDYVTVPFLIRVTFNDQLGLSDDWGVFGYTGAYYGWLIEASSNADNTELIDRNVENYTKDNDYGAVFGIGVSHKVNKLKLYSDIRYEMGIAEIIDYDTDLRNKTIAVSIGVNF